MKFTIVFTALLCVSTSRAVLAKKVEEPKDKREAQVSYGAPGHSAHSYQAPTAYSQGDASAVSVGAGYSIGGAKPTYSFAGQGVSSEGLSPNGRGTIQLAPITLQPDQYSFGSGDLAQITSQLSQTLNAGGLTLQPSNAIAELHQSSQDGQGLSQSQELQFPQFTFGAPKYEMSQQLSSAPAYSFGGTKGLSSYTSTGPVLFAPSEQQASAPAAPAVTYGSPSSGHSLGGAGSSGGAGALNNAGHALSGAGHALSGSSHGYGGSGHSLGVSGQSFGAPGQSFGAPGQSFGAPSHSLGGSGYSLGGLTLGGAGHSFGGAYKQLSYGAPSKTSFKPSAFLGATVQGEAGHGVSSLSGSYAVPSFGGFRGGSHSGLALSSAGHGLNFGAPTGGFGSGSSKFIAPVYQSHKPEGLEGASAHLSGHYASPPGTTYGTPTSSYSNIAHAASSLKPYYVSTKHHRATPDHYTQGIKMYRAPATSHGAVSAYSSGPKHGFAGAGSKFEATDAHGAASETSYNTIKYSEELKPRV